MKSEKPASVGLWKRWIAGAVAHLRTHAITYPLFILAALLLTVIQPPIGWPFFAWAAFVPFAVACSPKVKARGLAWAAFVIGYLYWLVNLYWIAPITIIGWLGLCLYLSLFWVLPAVTVRFVRGKGIPLFLALPILLAGWERLQGFPCGGFFWRFLGHSQYERLAVIQVADLVGAAGVSFVVAMVNGLIADLVLFIRQSRRVGLAPPETIGRKESVGQAPPYMRMSRRGMIVAGVVATVAVVSANLIYGQWRLRQTPEQVTDGPLVGSLQSNVPQSVKRSFSESGMLFDELMVSSKAAADAGAELIVWPETMVQGILDPGLWPHLQNDMEEDKAFHKALSEHAQETGSALLVGAYGAEIRQNRLGKNYLASYNSAYYYRSDGTRDPGRYDKIHLVLFGEYIPFQHRFPWLFEQLKKFFPEGYNPNYSLEHGRHYTLFEMRPPQKAEDGGQKTEDRGATLQTSNFKLQTPLRFGVIICYEDSIPYVGRNFTLDDEGRKRVDWLVNISNDGWFVRFPKAEGRVIASSELSQHAAICAFRAVENRLAVVRSVNTGVSCLIESTGRIRDGYLAASDNFPVKAMDRTALAGWFVDRLPIDKRVTFYSRHGEWFANGCAVLYAGVLFWPLVMRWRRRSRRTDA